MFKNSYKKSLLHDYRIINMKVMQMCLIRYNETQDEEYWEWAKVFGDWSKLYKKQIEELK